MIAARPSKRARSKYVNLEALPTRTWTFKADLIALSPLKLGGAAGRSRTRHFEELVELWSILESAGGVF
jgi:hypothetical protein